MAVSKAITCVLFFLYVIPEMTCFKPNALIGKRAHTPLEIEIVVVADYSAFNKWYELLDPALPHAKRVDIAKQNLTTWLGTMFHSANIVYKRLEADGLFISIKLVDLIIMTTVADSPWTETTKFKVNSTYMVDPYVVRSLFKVKSIELQKTIPHDHAMLFTRYSMILGQNGTNLYSGIAFIGAECKPKSLSIVEDAEQMATAQTIAHELGHSLGCEHDGLNNLCKVGAGYCMEAGSIKDNKNKWIFSSCSVDYIRNFVDKINRNHTNCLAKVNDNNSRPDLAVASQQWVGKLYSFDEQCIIAKGQGSYMCRELYHGNISSFCLKMYCHKDGACSQIDAGDGTPCASGSWCLSNNCVKDHRAPAAFDDDCPFGDQEGLVHDNLTCKQIALKRPNDCLWRYIKHKCCISCKHAQTTSISADAQCKDTFGPDSYMCRSISAYATSNYSSLCSKLYCFNTSTTDSCHAFRTYDKTPCGNKKWCIEEKCVHDSNAPAVPDDCPMGDKENDRSVSYNNLTCAEIRQHENNLVCYSNYTAKVCCKTCSDIRRNIKGCEYGDKNKDCFTLIASQRDSYHCYTQNIADICCESCNKYKDPSNIGCEYGNKNKGCADLIPSRSESYNCYGRDDVCCGSCKQYFNASDDKCHFGEPEGLVHDNLTCKQIAMNQPNDCLWRYIKHKCCISCKHAQTTAVSADTQCKDIFGPDSYMCRSIPAYATSDYSSLCSKLYCFNTSTTDSCHAFGTYDKTPCGNKKWCIEGKCVHDLNAPAVPDDCPMGDRENDRSVSYNNLTCAEIRQHENNLVCYSNYTAKVCCKTCSDIRRNIKGCEYGDKLYGCSPEKCSRLTVESRKSCCLSCKSSVIVG
ncbi:uncharacterized protein LOC123548610 [Mercenaria mercenaria]|uniref:uncharacterized protein LOC123548610 n=1 Tax=Mercenaria mercenaria TaxID=6596 RepID=UPI00234F9F9A|nr:uncharacterized protein LOC123548610 [Mercenaria mercenaria]